MKHLLTIRYKYTGGMCLLHTSTYIDEPLQTTFSSTITQPSIAWYTRVRRDAFCLRRCYHLISDEILFHFDTWQHPAY